MNSWLARGDDAVPPKYATDYAYIRNLALNNILAYRDAFSYRSVIKHTECPTITKGGADAAE